MSYVLLVDDEESNLTSIRMLLTESGFKHASTTHGAQALEQARLERPLIAISDLLMPVMDGFSLLRQWRADLTLFDVPFVVVAANYVDAEDEQLAMALGADAFVHRPFDPDVLMQRLKGLMEAGFRSTSPKPLGPASQAVVELKQYSRELVAKLEAKTLQLHVSNRALLQEIEERRDISLTQVGVLDAITANVCLIDSTGLIVAVNAAWRGFATDNFMQSRNFAINDNYLHVCETAKGRESAEAKDVAIGIRGVLAGRLRSFTLEYPCNTPTGFGWYRVIVTPLRGAADLGAVIMHVDVTDRRGAERRHEESEAQYLLLLNSTAEGIYRIDMNGICTFCNPTAARLLGYHDPGEVIGQLAHQHHHHSHPDGTPFPVGLCQIHPTLHTANGIHADHEVFIRSDGTQFPVECWSFPIVSGPDVAGTVVTFLDITQRQSLEAQFMQSQKMEAIGRLAGGVAHDFNNALQVILTYGELLEERLTVDEMGTDYTRQIMQAGRRAASLTQQLLTLSRQQIRRPTSLDISSAARELEDMLRMTIGEGIHLSVSYGAKGCTIVADRGSIQQVLINLAINARDAMPAGGELTISTSQVTVAAEDGRLRNVIDAGEYVMLSVRDTGTGMDAETQTRIFEPFFTTKPPEKGTGLGLSTVYGIVKQSKGAIVVDSAIGKGTDVRVYFPIVAGAPDAILQSESTAQSIRGSETILLVEDENSLGAVLRDILRANGYRVLEASDGNAAIKTADDCDDSIDLLLTDVILPGLSGKEVVDRLKARRPHMKVIYMSGYTDDYIAEHGVLDSQTVLLEKPFSIAYMLRKVREHLDGPAAEKIPL